LALAVAVTGLLATMPYIALQLVGIQVVLEVMGIGASGSASWLAKDAPLLIAFAVLAAYTYASGLRAPALIAFVKDTLIYVVIIAAIIVIPAKLGGWDFIFGKASAALSAVNPATGKPRGSLLLGPTNQLQYVTLALGSALALFLYPHSVTGVLAARSRNTIKRNMSALPAYSFVLGLIALLGYMALASGVKPIGRDTNTIVPQLFDQQFPSWFAGIAFAAVGIGALVPAAIMSIAAANLFTRNIYREYLRPAATPAQEARVSKITSLVVKVGAVACILFLDPQFSIDLQLIGGVIILQTLPAVALGLFTRWFHRGALVAGLLAGLAAGLVMLYQIPNPATGKPHFGGSGYALSHFGFDTLATIYVGFVAVLVNVLVAVVATALLRAGNVPDGPDATVPEDYFADRPVLVMPSEPSEAGPLGDQVAVRDDGSALTGDQQTDATRRTGPAHLT
jgi:SSS family solute:Na+ symporter